MYRNGSFTAFHFLMRAVTQFVQIYGLVSLLLFTLISWTVVVGYRKLHQRLEDMFTKHDIEDREPVSSLLYKLNRWKRKYLLLCDTVDDINNCFGLVLLVWVAHIFTSFITILFYMLEELRHPKTQNLLLFTINCSLLFELSVESLVLTIIPSRIRHEVGFYCNGCHWQLLMTSCSCESCRFSFVCFALFWLVIICSPALLLRHGAMKAVRIGKFLQQVELVDSQYQEEVKWDINNYWNISLLIFNNFFVSRLIFWLQKCFYLFPELRHRNTSI